MRESDGAHSDGGALRAKAGAPPREGSARRMGSARRVGCLRRSRSGTPSASWSPTRRGAARGRARSVAVSAYTRLPFRPHERSIPRNTDAGPTPAPPTCGSDPRPPIMAPVPIDAIPAHQPLGVPSFSSSAAERPTAHRPQQCAVFGLFVRDRYVNDDVRRAQADMVAAPKLVPTSSAAPYAASTPQSLCDGDRGTLLREMRVHQ